MSVYEEIARNNALQVEARRLAEEERLMINRNAKWPSRKAKWGQGTPAPVVSTIDVQEAKLKRIATFKKF